MEELKRRLPGELARIVIPALRSKKSIAPLRSFVAEPMRYERLFLPAMRLTLFRQPERKGLNLAAADVHFLSNALTAWYQENDATPDGYVFDGLFTADLEGRALFGLMTQMLHEFPGEDEFARRIREAELIFILLGLDDGLIGRKLCRFAFLEFQNIGAVDTHRPEATLRRKRYETCRCKEHSAC